MWVERVELYFVAFSNSHRRKWTPLGADPALSPLTARAGPRPASAPRPAAAPPGSAPARTRTGSPG